MGHGLFPSGHPLLDTYLDGGFRRGQLHEIFAGDADDNGSAAGLAAMLALCALPPGKDILWLRTLDAPRRGGRFNPAGLAELGGNPASLLMAVAPDDTALLRCAAEALRCDGFGAVIAECWGAPCVLDLTASRRLTLAANLAGVTAFLLRLDAQEQPSTADTRWSVRSAPSTPLAANAPGYPALDITLLRRRAGRSGESWRVEWDRDRRIFREAQAAAGTGGLHSDGHNGSENGAENGTGAAGGAPLPGAVVPLPARQPVEPGRRIKRRA